MPLEINEIAIRLRVDDEAGDSRRPSGDEGGDCACDELDRAGIVEDCVRQVLRALQNAQGR